ncbi:C2H2-type zinc finger protein [Halosimplex sp. TS25]|uniref:C2H2-type zinc finger protein n=1 Tax=Halosimplex rarum TaxID=3396619 RepID=UPI0039EA7FAD
MTTERTSYDVPPDRTPVECEYCGRPFENEGLLALHRGRVHAAAVDDEERDAYDAAYEAETRELRRFRLKALAVLILAYFGLLMVYAVV